MTRIQRIGLLGVAAIIAVAAFVLLQPEEGRQDRAAQKQGQPPVGAEQANRAPARQTERAENKEIGVEGGEPVGGIQGLSVRTGETVRFAVRSDVADEVHVHGYDRSRPVARGRPARFQFPADLEGVFEVELEKRGVEIAELRVQPR